MIRLAATGSASASMPKIEIGAGVGPQQPDDHAQRRGLAGAVRAEQRVELAGANGEVEPVDRRAVETLHQSVNFEGESRRLVHGRKAADLREYRPPA